jgi:phosphoribosylaminoimidazole synthetase
MCVNDLLAQGAEPLFFLDYFATGKLSVSQASAIIGGIAEGCSQAHAALIGGETAEMPGFYKDDDCDMAGFAVGVVERDAILPRCHHMEEGDQLIGIASSGIHANGYSLVRRVLEQRGVALDTLFDGQHSFADLLLAPTKIYVRSVLPLIQQGKIKGLAHITGGGHTENIPRILPDTKAAQIDLTRWSLPPIFQWLYQSVQDPFEMLRVFNNGIGMVLVVASKDVAEICAALEQARESAFHIGALINRSGRNGPQVVYTGIEDFFHGA